jgi:hypothetical protein
VHVVYHRFCATILLLSVVSGVFGASVAVDVVDPLVAIDNATLADNSTKALNVSDSSALKIRDVGLQLVIFFTNLYFSSCLSMSLTGSGTDVSMHLHECD